MSVFLASTTRAAGRRPARDHGSREGVRGAVVPARLPSCRIRQRFGAIGKHGSIALVERCIRTLKDEGVRRGWRRSGGGASGGSCRSSSTGTTASARTPGWKVRRRTRSTSGSGRRIIGRASNPGAMPRPSRCARRRRRARPAGSAARARGAVPGRRAHLPVVLLTARREGVFAVLFQPGAPSAIVQPGMPLDERFPSLCSRSPDFAALSERRDGLRDGENGAQPRSKISGLQQGSPENPGRFITAFSRGIRSGIVEFLKLVTSTFYANQVKQKNILFICSRLGSTLKVHVFDQRTQIFSRGPHLCT